MPPIFLSFIYLSPSISSFFFFFNDTPTTEIYTLSLHDALPICDVQRANPIGRQRRVGLDREISLSIRMHVEIGRATSELQSHHDLVCRLLLEKKKKKKKKNT